MCVCVCVCVCVVWVQLGVGKGKETQRNVIITQHGGGKREQCGRWRWNYGDERVYAGYQNQIGRKNARAINEAGKESHENRKQTSTAKLLSHGTRFASTQDGNFSTMLVLRVVRCID